MEQIFKQYYSRLVYFAFQLIGDKEQAEDIVQDTFIKYWNQREETGLAAGCLKSYLYTSVRNASLNVLRHQQVQDRFKIQADPSEVAEETVVHAIIRSEVVSALHAAIATLPASCQKVARLSFLEEKDNREIAAELGISVNTVKTQKQRGLQLLRLRLNPEIYTALLFLLGSQ
jgi:RNA polymerase sigma-70 factor (family 1)